MTDTLNGVFAAVLTRLGADGAPDASATARHCRWLLENGCDGLSVLGTTGEANSFTVDERLALLDGLAEAGIPGETLMPGVGCCALPDTITLARRAAEHGAGGVLMLPPFYYKNVGDDGLFAAFSEVIEAIGDDRLRVYVYHFPQMSGVPLPASLIERLLARYPGTVAGMKDSSGDLDNMVTVARAFPGFAVFSGSDELFWPLLQAGGAGCITAVSNVAAPLAHEVWTAHRRGDVAAADLAHDKLSAVRRAIAAYPLAAALKAVMARGSGDTDWLRIRPPLMPLSDADVGALLNALDGLGFALPPQP